MHAIPVAVRGLSALLHRYSYLLPGLIILAAFALRLYRLESKEIWWDEGWSVWLARNDIVAIALRTASDEHPPLHYWLLHFWNALAGESKYAVRFSSVFASVLTVALVYGFGKRFFGYGVALIGAALLAFSRFHIWWSQEIKMYALLVFLALLSLYLFLRAIEGRGMKYWALCLLVTLAALYTHYLAVLLLAVQWAVMGLALFYTPGPRKRTLLSWLFVQALVGLGFLPWIYLYLERSMVFEKAEAFDLSLAIKLYATALPLGVSTDLDRYIPVALLFSALAVAGGVGMVIKSHEAAGVVGPALVMAVLVVPLALVLFTIPEASIYHPKVSERYVIVFLPMYVIILAYGVWSLFKGHSLYSLMGVTALIGIVMVSGYMLTGYYAARRPVGHLEPLVRFIESNADRSDAVVLNTDISWPIYHYYLGHSIDRWIHVSTLESMSTDPAKERFSLALEPLPERIWLVTLPGSKAIDPEGMVYKLLERDFVPIVTKNFEKTTVTLYQRPEKGAGLVLKRFPRKLKGQTTSVGDVTFLGFEPLPTSWQGGDTIYLFTYWQLPSGLKDDYEVSAALVNTRNGKALRESSISLFEEYAGQLDRQSVTLQTLQKIDIRPTALPGLHDLQLEVADAASDENLIISLQKVNLNPPADGYLIGEDYGTVAEIGKLARLKGYYLESTSLKAGQETELHLVWEAIGTTEINYTVFVHVYDDQEAVWISGDSVPGKGEYPTATWRMDDTIEDVHVLKAPDTIFSGTYHVAVGFYHSATGLRLEATDGEGQELNAGRVVLADLELIGN